MNIVAILRYALSLAALLALILLPSVISQGHAQDRDVNVASAANPAPQPHHHS